MSYKSTTQHTHHSHPPLYTPPAPSNTYTHHKHNNPANTTHAIHGNHVSNPISGNQHARQHPTTLYIPPLFNAPLPYTPPHLMHPIHSHALLIYYTQPLITTCMDLHTSPPTFQHSCHLPPYTHTPTSLTTNPKHPTPLSQTKNIQHPTLSFLNHQDPNLKTTQPSRHGQTQQHKTKQIEQHNNLTPPPPPPPPPQPINQNNNHPHNSTTKNTS